MFNYRFNLGLSLSLIKSLILSLIMAKHGQRPISQYLSKFSF